MQKVTARMGRSSEVSGGTIASLLNVGWPHPSIRRVMGDPYSLSPAWYLKDGSDQSTFKYDSTLASDLAL